MVRLAFDKSMRSTDRFGRMRVEMTNISKANVCPYLGREIPNYEALGLDAAKVYQLWRHPDELAKAAPTFDMVPLLDEHIVVDAANPEQESVVGTTGTGTQFIYPYLKTPLAVWVGDSVDDVKTRRKRQLSCGYGYRADMTPGVTPDGVAYHGVMRDIMANHVTIVREGRAGPDVMVADEQPEEIKDFHPMKRLAVITALAAFFKPDADQAALDVALDAAMTAAEAKVVADSMAEMEAADMKANPDKYEDDPAKPGSKRKKVACDTAKPAAAAADTVSKDDAQKLAKDAATSAVAEALAAERALVKAREDVADVAGAVALDSAEAVYRFALKDAKVDGADSIHASALAAVWAQVKAGKVRSTAAMDQKTTTTSAEVAAAVASIGL